MELRRGFTLLQPRHSSLQLAQALQSVELIGLIRKIATRRWSVHGWVVWNAAGVDHLAKRGLNDQLIPETVGGSKKQFG